MAVNGKKGVLCGVIGQVQHQVMILAVEGERGTAVQTITVINGRIFRFRLRTIMLLTAAVWPMGYGRSIRQGQGFSLQPQLAAAELRWGKGWCGEGFAAKGRQCHIKPN